MSQVLGHQIDLLGALRLERLRFAHEALQRLGAVLAAHQGDGTEGARVVAAFGDLQITHVGLVAEELPHAGVSGNGIGDQSALGELGHEVMQVREPQKEVDLGNLVLQFLLISLDQAPDGHDRFDVAFLLELSGAQDRVDRFLLGGVDEAAGIDENDVGVRQIGGHHRAVAYQVSHQAFGIDRRFIAAERDDAELHPR